MKLILALCLICFATYCWGLPGTLVYEEQCADFVVIGESAYIHYGLELPVPFNQVGGTHYWISIQAMYIEEPTMYWFWSRCLHVDDWGFEGHIFAEYFEFFEWTPLSVAIDEAMNFSFVLHGGSGAEKWRQNPSDLSAVVSMASPEVLAECADDFFCDDGDPIVALEWWGYICSLTPYAFIIRFYEEDAPAVQECSWSVLKSLY